MRDNSSEEFSVPRSTPFKGIALFTPGGDLIYCIDVLKQTRWHLQLCAVLQEMLELPEPPHFLVPGFAATVDQWVDPRTQTLQVSAEASPLVLRHQALLNALFQVGDLDWASTPGIEELCNPFLINTYRRQFPQLWDNHDLVVRLESAELYRRSQRQPHSTLSWSPLEQAIEPQGYVLRLFIAGNNLATQRSLLSLHQFLEKSLQEPYTLKVIDIHKHPDLAEMHQISATPTLVKAWPPPVKRIVGDLDDISKILTILVTQPSDQPWEVERQG